MSNLHAKQKLRNDNTNNNNNKRNKNICQYTLQTYNYSTAYGKFNSPRAILVRVLCLHTAAYFHFEKRSPVTQHYQNK